MAEECHLAEKSIYNETIVIKQVFKWVLRHGYCAQQNLSYKYALEWMGHSSSAILDMYFTMNDRHSQAAMNSLSFCSENAENRTVLGQSGGVPVQTNLQTKQF